MKTIRRTSTRVGGMAALLFFGSASAASAALIHDIFDASGGMVGFIEYSTENDTDAGSAILGFQLDLPEASWALPQVNQATATWSIDPNTWVLSGGFIELSSVPCQSGGTVNIASMSGITSPGSSGEFIQAVGNCGNLPADFLAISYAPREPNDIPEPSALILFGLGLTGLTMMRRRQRTPSA